MSVDERVQAVQQLGFTERQARFLTTVMLHAGVCVPRQFATFIGTAYGHKVSRFFDRLVERRVAVRCGCRHNRAELYHVRQHALYRAIGEPNSRYRRPTSTQQAIERVARLDALVASPDVTWFSSEAERVAFCRLMAPSLEVDRLPHIVIRTAAMRRLRLFPDDVLMGVERNGRTVFASLVWTWDPGAIRGWVQRHRDLLAALPGWTFRFVFRRDAAGMREMVEALAREELTRQLRPLVFDELQWYFPERRVTTNTRDRYASDERFARCTRAFQAPTWQLLYRRWLADGDSVLEQLTTAPIQQALERGTGRIETQVLPFSYRHLSPVGRLDRPRETGVEDRARRPPQPRPPAPPESSTAAKATHDCYFLSGVPFRPPSRNNLPDPSSAADGRRSVPPG